MIFFNFTSKLTFKLFFSIIKKSTSFEVDTILNFKLKCLTTYYFITLYFNWIYESSNFLHSSNYEAFNLLISLKDNIDYQSIRVDVSLPPTHNYNIISFI